ncbi:hypothetical protein FQR65_LT06012 [Abscondita terminalis]|nr:hypothetical protein FQR65_LT06012 [Abscondita terminalis]
MFENFHKTPRNSDIELNENPKRIQQDVKDLRDWLKHQKHLKSKDDDQYLLGVLRRCKFSIEKAKRKLEIHYTTKGFAPDMFVGRDPFKKSIQSILTTKTIFVHTPLLLPTVYYVYWNNIEDMQISITEAAQMFFMNMDILINENDSFTINSFYFIVDFKDVPLKAFLKWDISLVKKFLTIVNSYPMRIKHLIILNSNPVFEKIYNILKIALSEKLQQKVILVQKENSNKLFEIVPRNLLPEELGGTIGNWDKLIAEWKDKVESYQTWFKDNEKFKSYEELRVGKAKTQSEIFGVEGSFRKLDCD